MTEGSSYELVLTPPAVRAIRSWLPEAVAAAVIEFVTGALVDNARRVGNLLRGDLAGIHSARRGAYRILYRINEEDREVIVMRIDHRRHAYGPGGGDMAEGFARLNLRLQAASGRVAPGLATVGCAHIRSHPGRWWVFVGLESGDPSPDRGRP